MLFDYRSNCDDLCRSSNFDVAQREESYCILQYGTGRETRDNQRTTSSVDRFGLNLKRNADARTRRRRRNWSRCDSVEEVKSRDSGFEFQRGLVSGCAGGHGATIKRRSFFMVVTTRIYWRENIPWNILKTRNLSGKL